MWILLLWMTSAYAVDVKLEDIKSRLETQNLELRVTVEQVYQSKNQIQLARTNLLPRLNLARTISSGLSPLALIEDIAPFLFPSNWIKIKEVKYLAQATEHSFSALKLNQLYMARTSAYSILADEKILSLAETQALDLHSWVERVAVLEKLGRLPPASAREVERLRLDFEKDVLILRQTLNITRSEMKLMLGMAQSEDLRIVGKFLEDESPTPVNPSEVFEKTPETLSFDNLILAAKEYRKGMRFSFLGFTSNARGLSEAGYDMLPQPEGLGFGLGPSLKIARRQVELLQTQRQATIQVQEKALNQVVDAVRTQKLVLENLQQRDINITESLRQLESAVHLGRSLEVSMLLELLRDRLSANADLVLARLHMAQTLERQNRILNLGDY